MNHTLLLLALCLMIPLFRAHKNYTIDILQSDIESIHQKLIKDEEQKEVCFKKQADDIMEELLSELIDARELKEQLLYE